MARRTRAADTLIAEAKGQRKRVRAEDHGDPDGFEVYREVRFDKPTSRWLSPILDVLRDPRIRSYRTTEAGYLIVRFVPDSRADSKAMFGLAEISAILND